MENKMTKRFGKRKKRIGKHGKGSGGDEGTKDE